LTAPDVFNQKIEVAGAAWAMLNICMTFVTANTAREIRRGLNLMTLGALSLFCVLMWPSWIAIWFAILHASISFLLFQLAVLAVLGFGFWMALALTGIANLDATAEIEQEAKLTYRLCYAISVFMIVFNCMFLYWTDDFDSTRRAQQAAPESRIARSSYNIAVIPLRRMT
jgi:lysylphosphatidylglycerol synthetase-like protein (DUF2156 family)